MALVNPGQTGTPQAAATAGSEKDVEAFKAAKKAAAKKHAEKIKEERQKDHERMLSIRDELKTSGAFEKLSKEDQDYILAKCVPPSERVGHTGPSFFTQVFGDKPAVGQSTTLKDIITKTYKGMDTVSASIKKWSAKGIEVKTEINKSDMLQTKYTITKLPA
jgi:hypothetical protein